MAKLTVGTGIEKYIAQLQNLEHSSPHIAGRAVYEGAKIVTDAIDASAASLPIAKGGWGGSYGGKDQGMVVGVTAQQKAGLRSSKNGGGLGIAKMKLDGTFFNVKAGYHGYNVQKTDKYPQGQPNAMIARSVEGGTSFRQKIPFISRAVKSSRAAAEKKMAEVVEEETKKLMK